MVRLCVSAMDFRQQTVVVGSHHPAANVMHASSSPHVAFILPKRFDRIGKSQCTSPSSSPPFLLATFQSAFRYMAHPVLTLI